MTMINAIYAGSILFALAFFGTMAWIVFHALSTSHVLITQGESAKGHSYRDSKQINEYQRGRR